MGETVQTARYAYHSLDLPTFAESDCRIFFFISIYGRKADQGNAHTSQNPQIIPLGWEWSDPYRSPSHPGTRNPFQCSPMMKYSRNPGVLISAAIQQGKVSIAVSSIPVVHGSVTRRRHFF